MEVCDLIVSAPWLLPIAPDNIALREQALAVSDGRIVALGPQAELRARYSAREDLALEHHVLLPGLVNAHGHLAMTLLRGAGEDQGLQDWLSQTIWPLESRLVSAEFVALGTELAIAEMARSGTTTFTDMYYFPEVVAEVAHRLHMRAQIAFPVIERPNPWCENVEEVLHKGMSLYDEYRHHPHINMMFGPHAAYTVTRENLRTVNMYANELEVGIQIHLHENQSEVIDALAKEGRTWIQHLAEIDILGPHLQAVHMTQISEADLETIVETGTCVVHCPTSNLKLASGYCDIERLLAVGVPVALGTDGAASNNALNLFAEARSAALLAKHHHADPTKGNARTMIALATLGGARCLGIDHQTGSLEVGKDADFIAVDTRTLAMQPLHDPFAALLHSEAAAGVDYTYVRGKAIVARGRCTLIDEAELITRTSRWHEEHIGR